MLHSPLKALYEGPMPPMALTDYETLSKFLNSATHRCKETGRDLAPILDWAIYTLTSSLTADSAARIFLPKTKTAPFSADDLLPIPEDAPAGKPMRIPLKGTNLIAPVWNNSDLQLAMESFFDSGFQDAKIEQPIPGVYIPELRLAILDAPAEVDLPYILRIWGKGSILLDSYSLKGLQEVLRTDGTDWFLREKGEEVTVPVLEPRMAALYNCGLRRFYPER